ncbi:MAG: YbjN domain-containing protein [Acetivibrionales bacterium]|jgi:hypothetical protein
MSKKIVFSTQTVDLITAELHDIKFSRRDSIINDIRLYVSIDFDTYQVIKKNGYFHLTYDMVPEKTNFSPDKEVLVTLKADPILVNTFSELNDDNLISELIASDDEDGEIIKKDINWYVLKVEQEVSLPDDLKETGLVFEGFETAYAIQDEKYFEDEGITGRIEDMIDEFKDIEYILKKYNIEFKREENDFSGIIYYKGYKWTYFIYEVDRVFVMYSAYTFFVPEESYDKVCREIVRINSELTVGNFDLDMSDGVLTFRTYLDIGDDILIPELFERMLIGNIATTGKYYTEIFNTVSHNF